MAQNLAVPQGATVTLDENPPAQLAGALQRIQIRTLDDLVSHGLIASSATLSRLLDGAKQVTAEAVSRRETYSPLVRIPGTPRIDLRRYGGFRAATPDVPELEASLFWRMVRAIPPTALGGIAQNTDLIAAPGVRINPKLGELIKFNFNDIEVQPNAVLAIKPTVQALTCNSLMIRRTGRIVVQGSGAVIRAFSIQGNM